MATLNFPDAPDTGDIYTDSNSGFTYEWNGTVWISKDPSTASNIREIDDISSGFNGSTTAFTLQVASVNVEPANVQQLIISVGGVMQNAGDDYTVSGSTLTFTTAPTSGLTFFGTLLGTALSLNTIADGSVTVSSLSTTTNYIMGGLTADQNAGIITSYGLVAGAGGVNVSGAVTGGSFSGDGSGLTGVASTDNIITSYGATFLSNVRIAGVLTAANAYVTGILTAQTLNYNNVVDIYSTGIITATRGIQQTGNEGLHVSSGITTVGILTATSARVGLGVTINNTGIDAGIGAGIITAKTYYGDATNMTGAGSTFQAISFDPFKTKRILGAQLSDNIALTFNHGIEAGNAAKEVTLRTSSATGTIVQSFGVGSSITYSAGQAILNPTDTLLNEEEYYVVVPEGAFKKIGTATSSPLINTYSFLTAAFTRNAYTAGRGGVGQLGYGECDERSSPVQLGSGAGYEYASVSKQYGRHVMVLKKDVDSGGNTLWFTGSAGSGKSGLNVTNIQRSSPTQVGTDNNWRSIVIGEKTVLATKTDNTIWGWGYGDDGALGQSASPNTFSSPIQIGTDTTWGEQIFNGKTICGAIKTDGTLWTWGGNQGKGALGLNDATIRYSPTQVGTDTNWRTLARGGEFAISMAATKTDGTLWTWGVQYQSGSLGHNDPNNTKYSSPTQVGTDTTWHDAAINGGQDEHASMLALKTNGTLWAWGIANDGRLGTGNNTNQSSPTQIGTDTTWGNGTYSDNTNQNGKTFSMANSTGAIKTDGTLWTWGNSQYGALGQHNRTNYSSPKQVGTGENWTGVAFGGISGNEGVGWFFEKTTT